MVSTRLRPQQLQARSKPEFQRSSRKHCDPGGLSRGHPCPRAGSKVYSTKQGHYSPECFWGWRTDACVAP